MANGDGMGCWSRCGQRMYAQCEESEVMPGLEVCENVAWLVDYDRLVMRHVPRHGRKSPDIAAGRRKIQRWHHNL